MRILKTIDKGEYSPSFRIGLTCETVPVHYVFHVYADTGCCGPVFKTERYCKAMNVTGIRIEPVQI